MMIGVVYAVKEQKKHKEENTMAVLARPVDLAFELAPDKVQEFLAIKDTSGLKRALEISSKSIKSEPKKPDIKER